MTEGEELIDTRERKPGLCFLRHVGVSPIAAMKPHCGYDSE